jgi:hypothetical protein
MVRRRAMHGSCTRRCQHAEIGVETRIGVNKRVEVISVHIWRLISLVVCLVFFIFGSWCSCVSIDLGANTAGYTDC